MLGTEFSLRGGRSANYLLLWRWLQLALDLPQKGQENVSMLTQNEFPTQPLPLALRLIVKLKVPA
jgi:hypothetical protein